MCKGRSWVKAVATVQGCGQPLHPWGLAGLTLPTSPFTCQQLGLPASRSRTSGVELCQPLFLQT